MPKITVICGPPGAGKSTYVTEHATAGDLIVDVDRLCEAISGLPIYQKPFGLVPYALAARDGILARLEKAANVSAWIIATAPSVAERDDLRVRFSAEVIVLEISMMSCLERIGEDERRAEKLGEWIPIVSRWWREYERSDEDTVIQEGR